MDDVARIDAVSKRFRHLLAVAVLDHRVDEDVLERQSPEEIAIEHHHARNPQRDDLARRAEHRTRVVAIKQARHLGPLRGIGPAER